MGILDIFNDAQKSTINHKSLSKRLRKLEAKAENDVQRYADTVVLCVKRCLEIPKSERAGLNTVKFVCTYCASTQAQSEDEESSPITCTILESLLPYLTAKDKTVRYRATQIVSQLMGIVTEIEDDLYQLVRHELMKRLRDRVPAIRLEAVCALGRLVENEMDEEAKKEETDDEDTMMSDEHESTGLLEKLLDVLQNDTNADVRKALLLNLPIEAKTLPYLLERARDKDSPLRRALYLKLMPSIGDFRHLSLSMREKLLRWGFKDRDERVRRAAAKMWTHLWLEQISKTIHEEEAIEKGEQLKKPSGLWEPRTKALLELIERVDTLNSAGENGVGIEAMKELWSARRDYFEAVTFDDDFWKELTAESAFMARTFYDHCARNKDALAEAEDRMPEVTRFGFHLQKHLQNTITLHENDDDEDVDEEQLIEQDFITEQLLHIAHTLDYTDEIGRRKMFSLLRNVLSAGALPEEVTKLTVEGLRLTCTPDIAGEKEFIAVVVQAVAEVHDELNGGDSIEDREASPDDADSFVSAQSELSDQSASTEIANTRSKKPSNLTPEEEEEKLLREILVTQKCLHITQVMLQNIAYSTFSTNVELQTNLNTLIIPALRSHEVPVRERGIQCLGLACLLSPQLAKDNWSILVHCLERGHDELQVLSLQILCDITLAHKRPPMPITNLEAVQSVEEQIDLVPFVTAFGFANDVQNTATTCLGKLMMCGFYKGVNTEVFDEAVQEAEQSGTKGWDLLVKVKATMKAEEQAETETNARSSGVGDLARRDS